MTGGQSLLPQVLGGITAFAQHRWAERRHSHERLTRLRVPVEWVVDASEPRIRLVGNYVEKLADAVETALRYSDQLLGQMPPSVTLAGRVWAIDPHVNAFSRRRTICGKPWIARRSAPFSRGARGNALL
jgi:hypothetical protein